MGVLFFTSWLKQQQKKTNISFVCENNKYADNLFIDANGTLYNSYREVYEEIGDNDINKLENLIISRTLKHYDYVINIIKPKEDVYISIDGIAPFAKITQQRIRRYTSYIMDTYENKNIKWSPNANISPSTNFMKKFDEALTKYCKTNNYIYSSYAHYGEGEHKIIQTIKTKYLNKNNIIYSPDTDIIFLSLILLITKYNNDYKKISSTKINLKNEQNHLIPFIPKNIYIFRFEGSKSIYFNIYKIKLLLLKYIKYIFRTEEITYKLLDNQLILDFIILCFIIGNDFLQNIPFITAYKLNYVIKAYGQSLHKFKDNETILYNEKNIYKINYYNLSRFIRKLAKYELELFKLSYFENSLMNHFHNITQNKNLIEIEKIRQKQQDYIYFNNFNLMPYLDENKNIIKDNITQIVDILITYKYNYYDYYLKSNNSLLINNMINNYMYGIKWTVDYYFNTNNNNNILNGECLNWNWYYKFNCMPFISDIAYFLKFNNFTNIKENKILNNKPLTNEEQLLYIIPYEYLKDINIKLYNLLNNKNYLHPKNLKIDTINKNILWTCHCIIPLYDSEYIRNII